MAAKQKKDFEAVADDAEFVAQELPPTAYNEKGQPFVIVRTEQNASPFCGWLVALCGTYVKLAEARRIYSWVGAGTHTLNEVATIGCDVKKSEFSVPRPVELTLAVEVIECSVEATRILRSASWKEAK
jgi:hypothetical protein